MMRSFIGYPIVGLLLFAAYLLQHLLDLRWQEMHALQQQEWYKLSSGIALLALILFQWYFSRVRANPRNSADKTIRHFNLHVWLGAVSPLFFYLHAATPGYAYLLVLTVLFFGNLLLGVFNNETLPVKSQWFYQGWMILHVGISCLITALVVVHVFMVMYYE